MLPDFLAHLKGLLIDLDGVVYRGDTPTPGATEFFARLRHLGLRYLLTTNNSTRTPAQFAARLRAMGIAVEPDEVLSSAVASAMYLERVAPPGARVMVVGEAGLREAVAERGFILADEAPDFVVAGLDRHFDYGRLTRAARAIKAGARFVATNPDASLPTADGELPGAGSILAAISVASGVQPVVIGKPEPTMLLMGAQRLGLTPEETAMVGDRLDTDVAGARRAGMPAILVLTGISTREDLPSAQYQPDLVCQDLRELAHMLEWSRKGR